MELISKYEIYAMYKQDSLRYNLEHLSLPAFYKAFRTVYPFVHIRRKKSVTGSYIFLLKVFFMINQFFYIKSKGKCNVCATLGELRRKHLSGRKREQLEEIHAVHKLGFMSERRFYYQ